MTLTPIPCVKGSATDHAGPEDSVCVTRATVNICMWGFPVRLRVKCREGSVQTSAILPCPPALSVVLQGPRSHRVAMLTVRQRMGCVGCTAAAGCMDFNWTAERGGRET
ncbi:hypothetical protein GOODEAATRI_009512 [Goodea atripinnis]|uniref:Uncharacterized protein n=1 Tax=Goodea atripinnis TaxID=208336 RepID=A0ABV0PX41_9TELE